MRLTSEIGEYEMDRVILDLGSNANVPPKQTCKRMGITMLQWSPIQLQMANQQKIFPVGILQGVTVDIEGGSRQVYFEVIEIVNDSNPYPTLLGIDWATNMNGVINMKKHKMTFEKKSLHVVVPLDPAEVARYTKSVCNNESDDNIDCIYKITVQGEDCVSPTVARRILWEHESSCTLDSDEEIERWQNRLQEVTMLNYNMMIWPLCCVKT